MPSRRRSTRRSAACGSRAPSKAAMADSIWKKEISLRRKPKPERPEVAPRLEAQSELPAQAMPVHIPDLASPEPAAVTAPAPAVPPSGEAPPLPAGDYGWLTADFDPTAIPDKMPAVSAPDVEVAAPAPAPAAAWPEQPGQPEHREQAAQPKEPSLPFWKRELKLSLRKSGPKEPKQPKAKQPKEPKEPSAPFWKRELKLSLPKLERGPKQVKQPKQPKQPKLSKQPKQSKLPKLPRERRQQRSKGGAGKGAVIGLKIGASQVAAARVSNSGGPQLLQVARVALPDGVVVGGELRDVEGLAEALKELFAANKLPKRNVRLGIANNRIGVRTFEISGIDDPRQLANAIRFRAQETLPIPLEEAVLDWQVLSESNNAETGEKIHNVLLVVAYRELVDRYISACRKAGIRLSGIDLEAFAMLRALEAPAEPNATGAAGARVMVNVGHDRSTFAVSNGRVCEFTRVLGWGGQNLSVAIARALDLVPSQATPIKHALSLVAQSEPSEDFSPETLGTAREAVIRELQVFARELVSSLRFYQNQPGSLGIGEVVLTGGTAHLPGFAGELHTLIGVPVRVGDPLNRVAVPKKFREPDDYPVGSLTVAIGLGIED